MTPRQLFKGSHSVSLNELFGNVVKGLWIVAIFMTAECKSAPRIFRFIQNVDTLIVLERAHLEFKVSAWMTYFKSLQPCLSDMQLTKPTPPEESRRVAKLPDLSRFLLLHSHCPALT